MEKSSIRIGRNAFILAFVILLVLMIAVGILTRVLPAGSYDRVAEGERVLVVPDSFAFEPQDPLPVLRWFTAPVEVLFTEGSIVAITIILFLIFVGGAFTILEQAGVLKVFLDLVVHRFRNRRYLLMALLQLFFMGVASALGIYEAMVPLIVFIVPLAIAFGWDSLTGLGMSLLPLAFGFSAAIFNPFTIGVAQRIAGLPLFSGAGLRVVFFVITYTLVFLFVARYARRIDNDPTRSLVYREDAELRAGTPGAKAGVEADGAKAGVEATGVTAEGAKAAAAATKRRAETIEHGTIAGAGAAVSERPGTAALANASSGNASVSPKKEPTVSPQQRRALLWFGGAMAIAFTFILVTARIPAMTDLAFPIMALLFLIGGIGAGVMSGMGGRGTARAFVQGALQMLPGVVLILMALSVRHIFDQGGITDTVLYYASSLIRGASNLVAAFLVYLVTFVMNFFIGSASAKAFLMMPILAPLSDLVGITRQTAVLAFDFGDGFSNMLFPTNALLLIGLGFTTVTYPRWIRWTIPLQLLVFGVSAVFLTIAVLIEYGPF